MSDHLGVEVRRLQRPISEPYSAEVHGAAWDSWDEFRKEQQLNDNIRDRTIFMKGFSSALEVSQERITSPVVAPFKGEVHTAAWEAWDKFRDEQHLKEGLRDRSIFMAGFTTALTMS